MLGVLTAVKTVVLYIVAPAIVGGLLHELTHAVLVIALGHDLEGMNLHRLVAGVRRGSSVVYTTNYDSGWNGLIGTAPVFIGLAAALSWVVAGLSLEGNVGLALAVCWAFYSFGVSREDLLGGSVDDDPQADRALHGVFIAAVGFSLLVVDHRLAAVEVIGTGLVLGGVLVASWNARRMWDSVNDWPVE